MDLFDVSRIAVRRWWVTLPVIAIALFVAYSNYTAVKPVYISNASIALTAPSQKVVPAVRADGSTVQSSNGLADAGGVSLMASVLATSLQQPAVTQQIRAADASSSVSIKAESTSVGGPLPIVSFSGTASSAEGVQRAVSAAVAAAAPTMRSIQANAGVPVSQMVSVFVIAEPSPPVGAMPSRTREAIATLIAGVLVGIVLSVAVDQLMAYLRRRRILSHGAHDPIDETDEADAPGQRPEQSGAHAATAPRE